MRRPALLALLSALGLHACNGGHPPVVETGVTAEDHPLFQPRLRGEESFGETWTAIGLLADGGYLQAQLAVTNVGPGSEKGACRVLYVPPRGAPWSSSASVDREAWRHEASPDSTLHMGPCAGVATAEGITLKGEVGGGRFSLRLKQKPQRTAPPDHHVKVEDDFYTSTILVPWADAELTITPPDGAPVKGLGRGYADHSRATTLPGDLARRWVRVRQLTAGAGLLALLRYPPEEGAPPSGWVWREGEPAPAAITEATAEALKPIKDAGAWALSLRAPAQAPLETTSGPLMYRAAPVEDQGMLGPFIEAVIGNPVTYTYRQAGGVMEVTIVDE